jgi:hypothetical protein
MRRYKEERRRQLTFHVDIITNQSVNLFCRHAQVYFHVDIIHNQSVNLYFTHPQVQGRASWLFTWTLSIINQLTSIVRMRR